MVPVNKVIFTMQPKQQFKKDFHTNTNYHIKKELLANKEYVRDKTTLKAHRISNFLLILVMKK